MALTERLAARGHTGRVVRELCWLAVVGSWALCGLAAHAALQSPGEGQRGQRVFQHCYACHSVQPGELNLLGRIFTGWLGVRPARWLRSKTTQGPCGLPVDAA
jgi:hypothetical protein